LAISAFDAMQSSVGHANAVQKHSASGMCTISSPCQPAQKCLKQQHRSQRTRCFVAAHASNGSAANGASSLLKLSIPFATEFGDSVAVTTSTSGWSIEEVHHVACCCGYSHVVKSFIQNHSSRVR
jgi:hypothetical protein